MKKKSVYSTLSSYTIYTILITLIFILSLSLVQAASTTANIDVNSKIWNATICSSEKAKFEFEITNTGLTKETYNLEFDKLSEYIQFSQNPVTLSGKQKQTVYAYITLPIEQYGEFDLLLTVTAQNSGWKAKKPFSLIVNHCRNFNIEFGEYELTEKLINNQLTQQYEFKTKTDDYNLCENGKTKIPIKLTNLASLSNYYNINLEAPKYAKTLEQVKLDPHSSGIFEITVDPKTKHIGEHEINLTLETEVGKISKTVQTLFITEKCFDFELELESNGFCVDEKNEINLIIKNNASKDLKLLLEHNLKNLELENKTLIQANQDKTLTITSLADLKETGSHKFILSASAEDSPEVKKELRSTINIVSQEECREPKIFQQRKTIFYDTTELELKLQNSGVKTADYEVAIQAEDWITLKTKELTLKSGEEGILKLNLNPTSETVSKKYEVLLLFNTNNQTYSEKIELQLTKKLFDFKEWDNQKVKDFFKEYMYYIVGAIVIILIIILLVFLFHGKDKKSTKKHKSTKKTKRSKTGKIRTRRNKGKNLWKIISIIVILLVLASLYHFFNKEILDFLKVYWLYIVVGLIILAVIIILLKIAEKFESENFLTKLLDFFFEEGTKKRRK